MAQHLSICIHHFGLQPTCELTGKTALAPRFGVGKIVTDISVISALSMKRPHDQVLTVERLAINDFHIEQSVDRAGIGGTCRNEITGT